MAAAYSWDLLMRYRLIEIVALWEGRVTTNHLCNSFDIGRQQASKIINNYIQQVAPGNLRHNPSLRGYEPTASFKPQLTSGIADEYLHVLSRSKDSAHMFAGLDLAFARTEILQVPLRPVEPVILRALVQAAREQKRVRLSYISLSSGVVEERVIVPHTLVCTPSRWHVRAYCEKHDDYRDFVLSRFRGVPEVIDASPHSLQGDTLWHTEVSIVIAPDQRLYPAQQAILAHDYGMIDGCLELKTRAPLVSYLLKALNLDLHKYEADPLAQQIEIRNRHEVAKYLIGS